MKKMKYAGNLKSYHLEYYQEEKIKDLLMFHKIVKVENDTFYLDNGVTLEVLPNEGCGGCSNGWYGIDEINGCDNVITDVEFDEDYGEYDSDDDYEYDSDNDDHFSIFVYAENKRIKILDVSGHDNGYYGQGYRLHVRIPRELELEEEMEM